LILEISVVDKTEILEIVAASLRPDNNSDIKISKTEEALNITVRNLKASSLYSVPEELLRCYEVAKKIMGWGDRFTAPR